MGFSRQECWSGRPFPSPEDLLKPEIEPRSPALAGGFFTIWATKEAHYYKQHSLSRTLKQLNLFQDDSEKLMTHESEKWKLVSRLCPTLCDPVDCSPPGSSIHGILQARVPEWVAISFSGTIHTSSFVGSFGSFGGLDTIGRAALLCRRRTARLELLRLVSS